MGGIGLRRAKLENIERLTRISQEVFNDDAVKYFGLKSGGPIGYDSVEWNYSRINNDNYFEIILDDNIIGGIIIFYWKGIHALLDRIFIDVQYQGKGIGQKVIPLLENEFPQVNKWSLYTRCECYRNHHFYEKMGYNKISQTNNEIYYIKELSCELNNKNIFIESNIADLIYYKCEMNNMVIQDADIINSFFSFIKMNNIKVGYTSLIDLIIANSLIDGLYCHDNNFNMGNKPSVFENCNLTNSIFKNCDLSDVKIENCDITNLFINGININDLINKNM